MRLARPLGVDGAALRAHDTFCACTVAREDVAMSHPARYVFGQRIDADDWKLLDDAYGPYVETRLSGMIQMAVKESTLLQAASVSGATAADTTARIRDAFDAEAAHWTRVLEDDARRWRDAVDLGPAFPDAALEARFAFEGDLESAPAHVDAPARAASMAQELAWNMVDAEADVVLEELRARWRKIKPAPP
jgi:hypothetical protein